MDRATVNALLAKRNNTASGFPEDDVEVPGIGTVRVRGLSRFESMSLDSEQGTRAMEQQILLFGMVDPALTHAQIVTWQNVSDGREITPVLRKINELSGFSEGDPQKAAYKSDGDGSDAGVRVLPSAGAGQDGGEPASGDAG